MEFEIKHDENNFCFYAVVSDQKCELKYKKENDHTLDYYSTFVPNSLRGQGIAGKITEVALNYARDNHYKVIPSCPFVEKYIDEHPQFVNLLT